MGTPTTKNQKTRTSPHPKKSIEQLWGRPNLRKQETTNVSDLCESAILTTWILAGQSFKNLVDLDFDQPSFFGQDWKEKKLFSGPLCKDTWCFLWAFCWRLHFPSSSSGSLAHRDDEHRRWWIFYIEILPQLSKTGTKNLNCESVSSWTNTTRSQWIWNFFKDLCAKLHTMALQHLLVAKFRWKALEIGHQKCIGWPQWWCLFISIYIYI